MSDMSGSADTVTVKQRLDAIRGYDLSSKRYYHHEAYLAKVLGFEDVVELRGFIDCIQDGGSKNEDGDFVPNPEPYDGGVHIRQKGVDNDLQFHLERSGRKVGRADRYNDPCPRAGGVILHLQEVSSGLCTAEHPAGTRPSCYWCQTPGR